jgi:hypothetical protein
MNIELQRNWLFEHVWSYMRWALTIYRKLAAIVPRYTASVMVSSLIAEISILLAFILPLKIIILIGSPRIPRYFPRFFTGFDKDMLAIILGIAAAGFYVLYLVSTKWMEKCSERGAVLLLERSRKLALFHNQKEIAKKAYKRFSVAVEAILFAALGLLLITFIYPALAGFFLSLLLFFYVVLSVTSDKFLAVQNWITANAPGTVDVLAAVSFLSACGFIIVDYILLGGGNIFYAVISLILLKQIISRLSKTAKDAISLVKQKPQITALFFRGRTLVDTIPHNQKGFWQLIDKKRRAEWMSDVLNEVMDCPLVNVNSSWYQTGSSGVVGFDVSASCTETGNTEKFFIKLFDAKQHTQAVNEATLLGDSRIQGLPSPRLVTTVSVEGFQCLVFEAVPNRQIERDKVRNKIYELMMHSWYIAPPDAFVNLYHRSKAFLGDRLDEKLFHRLRIAANTNEQAKWVDRFGERVDEIKNILSQHPLFFYNPDININTIRTGPAGREIVTHWGAWSLEPVGAGWPVIGQELEAIGQYVETASKDNARLTNVPLSHIRLAAFTFAFERYCQQEKYLSAIELIPDIFTCLDAGIESGNTEFTNNIAKV